MYNVDYNTCPGRRPRPPRSAAAVRRRRPPPPYTVVCHYRPLPPFPAATHRPPAAALSHLFSGGISTGLWTTSARALAVSADGGVGLLDGGRITDGVGGEAGRSDESCGGRPELLDDPLCEDRGGDLTRYDVEGGGVSCSKGGSMRLFAECSDSLSMSKMTSASVHMSAHGTARDAVPRSPSSTSCGAG